MPKTKVLFLCTGNSARSQMAETFLRRYGGDRFDAYSAGLEPRGIHPLTIKVMQEIGLDLQGQYAKDLHQYMGKVQFDYLITVCDHAAQSCPFFPGMGTQVHWSLEDPAAFEGSDEEKLAKFREIRDQIEARVRAWIGETGEATNTGVGAIWLMRD